MAPEITLVEVTFPGLSVSKKNWHPGKGMNERRMNALREFIGKEAYILRTSDGVVFAHLFVGKPGKPCYVWLAKHQTLGRFSTYGKMVDSVNDQYWNLMVSCDGRYEKNSLYLSGSY